MGEEEQTLRVASGESAAACLTEADFPKLTKNQKAILRTYGYFLSPEAAEKARKIRKKDIIPFCQINGSRNESFVIPKVPWWAARDRKFAIIFGLVVLETILNPTTFLAIFIPPIFVAFPLGLAYFITTTFGYRYDDISGNIQNWIVFWGWALYFSLGITFLINRNKKVVSTIIFILTLLILLNAYGCLTLGAYTCGKSPASCQ